MQFLEIFFENKERFFKLFIDDLRFLHKRDGNLLALPLDEKDGLPWKLEDIEKWPELYLRTVRIRQSAFVEVVADSEEPLSFFPLPSISKRIIDIFEFVPDIRDWILKDCEGVYQFVVRDKFDVMKKVRQDANEADVVVFRRVEGYQNSLKPEFYACSLVITTIFADLNVEISG